MQLRIFNSYSKNIEEFKPINAGKVKMYVCGPTIYDFPHIGNCRAFVVFDLFFRLFRQIYGQQNVTYVRNITDIDDKIIERAKHRGISIGELTTEVMADFLHSMEYFGCLTPTYQPRATKHLPEMIMIIERLIASGHAYQADGHVYFTVESYDKYSQLSGRNLDDMQAGARIEVAKAKKHPGDFVLWKPASEIDPKEVIFDSPFGKGRPGWHIECSAMSYKYLGADFDIHGGGHDLIFPHHSNEIAQSCCAFKGSSYAKYWLHNGFLTVDGEKMSKSLGNFITAKELIDNVNGMALRLFLLRSHYRKPLDYNQKALRDCQIMLNFWHQALEGASDIVSEDEALPEEFMHYLLDDLNSHMAVTTIHNYAKLAHSSVNEAKKQQAIKDLFVCAKFIGVLDERALQTKAAEISAEVKNLLAKRHEARRNKQWQESDDLRGQISALGYELKDMPNGEQEVKSKR